MPETRPTNDGSGAKTGLAAVGIAAFAVACCAGAPLLVGLVGGIAVASLLGVGAAIVGAAALAGVVLLVVRRRRRPACAVPGYKSASSARVESS
jgi:membrane protein implicated in regulation of membrane protease activity